MATASCTTRGRSCPTRKAGTDCTASGAGRSSDLMAAVPMMTFPVEWVVIDGNRVVYYPWQVLPDPKGGDGLYRFGCGTILRSDGRGTDDDVPGGVGRDRWQPRRVLPVAGPARPERRGRAVPLRVRDDPPI